MKTIVMCPFRPSLSHLTLSAPPCWFDTSTPNAAYPAQGKSDAATPARNRVVAAVLDLAHIGDDLAPAEACI
jgi:hypothetical protein